MMRNHFAVQLVLIFTCLLLKTVVFSQCNADAGPNITMCAGESEELGDSPSASGNSPFTYSWSPATGLSCTNCPNPICTAVTTTIYTLTITDDNGCTDSDNVTVTVAPDPVASFTFSPNNGCSTVPIQFTSTSTGFGLNYSWNFGDPGPGNNSSQANPTHDFNSNGTGSQSYNVRLIVTNSAGCKDTVIQTVTVAQSPGAALLDPINSFKNCDGSNFDMTVYDVSLSPGTSYTIIWGDGTPNFTGSSFPGIGVNHLYSTSDIFDLYYIVVGTNGCSDTLHQLVSNITNPAIGAANPGATTGCGPMTLCFPLSNYSSNHSSTYYIVDYGDNSPLDTLPHPPPAVICHTYTQSSCGQPGNAFTFKMKAINSCDSSLASISPIRVYSGPQANFNVVPNGCVGTPITFFNTSILGFNSTCSSSTLFTWNFGDGQTITSVVMTNPSHVYTAPGNYIVTLSTQNACGTTIKTDTICIEAVPIPLFTLNPDTACVPFNAQVSNLSTALNSCTVTYNWSVIFNGSTCLPSAGTWNFLNGTTASSFEPEFQFVGPGQYTVRLTMTNTCGTFIYDRVVIGQAPPQISLTNLPSICLGNSVSPTATINDCYEPADTYNWTFTGGLPASSNLLVPGSIQFNTAGTYNIDLQVSNLCGTVNATTPLIVFNPPVANAGPDVEFCSNSSGNIGTPPVAGISYSWNPTTGLGSPSNSASTVTLSNGTTNPIVQEYILTASSSPTCFTNDTVEVIVDPLPLMTVNSPTICNGESVLLNVSGAGVGGNYTWSPTTFLSCSNCDSPTANSSATTVYTITGTNVYNCQSSIQSTVTVNPLPVISAGPDQILCDQPIPITLNGSPVGGNWTGSPNVTPGGIFTPNGPEVALLVYTFVDPVTLCENSDTASITVNPPIIPTVEPFDSLCSNAGITNLNTLFNANPLGGVWSGTGVTSPNIDPSASGVGSHILTYSYGTGTCLININTTIKINPQPTITVNSDTICFGESVGLLVTGAGIGGNYSWSPATGLSCSTCDNPIANPASTTIYTIIGTNTFGCSGQASSTITVNLLPIVNAGPDQILCDQPIPFTLAGSPAGGTWTGSPNVTSGGVFTPNGTEISSLVYTYSIPATGCTNSDTMVITVNPPILPTVDPALSICDNSATIDLNLILNPSPVGGTWSGTGVTNPQFNPIAAGVGSFTIEYTYGTGTCQAVVSSVITVDPSPFIVVNSGTICNGENITLSASGAGVAGVYTWTPTTALSCSNCDTTIANPTATTVYTVSGTNSFGCSRTTNATVTVNPLPIVNAGPDQTLCDQPIAVTLTGTPAGGNWSGSGNVTSTGIFTPNGPEITTLYYTYSFPATACSNIDSMVMTVVPPVVPTIDPSFSICVNNPTVDLNAVLNPSHPGGIWSGVGVSNPSFNPSVAGVGTHIVSYTYGAGTCLNVVSSNITVNPQPTVVVNNETICFGESTVLSASGAGLGGNYQWTPTTALSCTNCDSTVANPISTTIYTVTGTTLEGCTNSSNATVTVNPLPLVNAGIDTSICNLPVPIQLNGTIAGGSWTGTGISPSGLFTPTSTGTFTLTYTVVLGTTCSAADSMNIQVVAPTFANAGPDLEFCIDQSTTTVIGNPAGGVWTGTNVNSGGLYTISNAGAEPLVYTTGSGNCLTRDTMLITIHPLPIVNAGMDQDFCLSDASVSFSGSPAGGSWTGTGITNASLGTFDPQAAVIGVNTIVYTFTDPITNCTQSDTLLADVHPLPAVSFTFNPIICEGISETFNNTSTLVNSTVWDFGDGSTSALNSPSHSYANVGFYSVQAIVSTAFGCLDSLTQTIEVREMPVADFALAPDSACGPVTVNFTNNSSGVGVSYTWDFGNGQTSTLQNPGSITYLASLIADTTYYIELAVTNMCGTVMAYDSVIVMPKPLAIFGPDFNSGCSPFTANFASTSLGLPDSYYWDFGNGFTSSTTDSIFQQTFTTGTTPTDYTIMLVVLNECGTDTAYHTITALPNSVSAFFNTSTTTACNNLTVDFTQYTLGGTLWSWDFGDGTTSSAYSPSHTYTLPGIYDVSLFANDGCGFDTTTVTITVNPSPIVDFSFTPDSLCINTPFSFINESVGPISSSWSFGDGTNSNLTDPVHQYATTGFYQVTLTGTSLINGCTASVSQTMHVNVNPVAQFVATPLNGCVPLAVQMTNQSTNAQYYSWDFGDGNTSSQLNPQHTFTAVGTYTIQLIVENVNGCSDTSVQNITVHPLPVAAFVSSYNCGSPVTMNFTNQSTGANNYSWDFGNGQTSSLTDPSINYATPGTYTVSLVASNQYGCVDQVEQIVTIYPSPSMSFSLPVAEICAGDALHLIANTLNVDSVVWYLGDGSILTGDSIDYSYSVPGSYFITATAYGGGACTTSVSAPSNLTVNPSAIADFEYENVLNDNLADGLVQFTNQSTNASSYYWDFGDSNDSYETNPLHQFSGFTLYNTTLYAMNEFGCNDTLTIEIDVDFFNGLYLPNAIYPGHSDFEVSHFIPKGVGLKEFELLIYDDWGNLIWQTTALDADGRPTESWDGTFNGEQVQQDAYVWKVTAVFLDESAWEGKEYKNGKFKKAGTVTVIR